MCKTLSLLLNMGYHDQLIKKKGSQWLSELVAVDIFTLVWSSSQAAALASGSPFVSDIFKLVRMRLLNSSIFKVILLPDCSDTHKRANNQQNSKTTKNLHKKEIQQTNHKQQHQTQPNVTEHVCLMCVLCVCHTVQQVQTGMLQPHHTNPGSRLPEIDIPFNNPRPSIIWYKRPKDNHHRSHRAEEQRTTDGVPTVIPPQIIWCWHQGQHTPNTTRGPPGTSRSHLERFPICLRAHNPTPPPNP